MRLEIGRNGEPFLTRSEIWRIEKYLRSLFRLDTITLLERPKQTDWSKFMSAASSSA